MICAVETGRINWRLEEREFVVRTKQGRELMAAGAIAATGHPTWTPLRSVEISHARKRERVNRPLYQRYIFVRFIENDQTYGVINGLRNKGVIKLLCDLRGIPIPVPKAIMANVRDFHRRIQADAGDITTGWQPGDTFKIACGRYADFDATYVEEDKGEVTVIVRMFNRDMPMQIPFADIPLCERAIDRLVA